MNVYELKQRLMEIDNKNDHDNLSEKELAEVYDAFKDVVDAEKAIILNSNPDAEKCDRFAALRKETQDRFDALNVENMSTAEKRVWLFHSRIVNLKKWIRLNRLGVVKSVVPMGYEEYRITVDFNRPSFTWTIEDPMEMLYSLQSFNVMAANQRFGLNYSGFHAIRPQDTPAARKFIMYALGENYNARNFEFNVVYDKWNALIKEYSFVVYLKDVLASPIPYIFCGDEDLRDNKKLKRTMGIRMMRELTSMMTDRENMAKKFDVFDDVMTLVGYALDADFDEEKYMQKCEKYKNAIQEYSRLIDNQQHTLLGNDERWYKFAAAYTDRFKSKENEISEDFPFCLDVYDRSEWQGKDIMIFKPKGFFDNKNARWDMRGDLVVMNQKNLALIEQEFPDMRILDMNLCQKKDYSAIYELTLISK